MASTYAYTTSSNAFREKNRKISVTVRNYVPEL